VISEACADPEILRSFTQGMRTLVTEQRGAPVLVGATAGLRQALDEGVVTQKQILELRQLLPPKCALRILTPQQEAHYELRCMREFTEASHAMMSMGGKSMQLGREKALYSLPFAMHMGYDFLIENDKLEWRERIPALEAEYVRLASEEMSRQGIGLIEGTVVGITDTVQVAKKLQLVGKTMKVKDFLEALTAEIDKFMQLESMNGLKRENVVFAARVILMKAVIATIIDPEAHLLFRDDFKVSWTAGFFLDGAEMHENVFD